MTVQANLPPTNTNSDGVTTTFNYGFKVTREEHLAAMYTVIATGETGDLEIDSVTGVGNDGGGTVTFATAPADGMIVTVDSIAPLSQIEAFTGNKLPPATVERMGDAIAIQNQRQQSQIERSVRFPASDDQIPTLPAKAQRADKILGFTADGSDFAMVEGAAASQAYVDQAEAQADRAVAAATYPYTSGEQKTGAYMPGAGETLTLFTYNAVSAAAVTLPALSGLAAGYNIGICRTAGSGAQTISAADGALVNGSASIVHDSDYLCLDFTINEAGDEWVVADKALIGLPVGTTANDIVALDGDAKLPAVDGSQLLNVRDDTARDTALTTFIRAEILAEDPAGTYGKIISDNFLTDTLAVSTNATYDAAGDYYHNPGGVGSTDVLTGGTASTDNGGGASKVFDDDTGTTWYTSADGGAATLPNHIQYDCGSGVSHVFRRVKITNAADGTYSPTAFTIAGSNDGSSFTTLDTQSGLSWSGGETKTFDFANSTAYRYLRITVTATSDPANWTQIAEIEAFAETDPPTMTLQSAAVTLEDADPDDMTALFRVEDIDTIINGTDRVISFSIDNGVTFATATITVLGAYGDDDTLIKAFADTSLQTGDQFVWKCVAAKSQRIKQIVAVPGY